MTENENNLLEYYERLVQSCVKQCDGVCDLRDKECECVDANVLDHLREFQEYRAIGTIEEFKALKDKSEPRKPFQPFGTHSYKCPSCWKFVAHEVDDNCDLEAEMAGWCPYCGQKLDWQ